MACTACTSPTSGTFTPSLQRAGGKFSTVTSISNAITGSDPTALFSSLTNQAKLLT